MRQTTAHRSLSEADLLTLARQAAGVHFGLPPESPLPRLILNMPYLPSPRLKQIAYDVFRAAGATNEESKVVGDALVEANIAGLDSHGILRIPEYVRWVEKGLVTAGATMSVVLETDSFALIDGGWGFGQVMGRHAMRLGIEKATRFGVATVSGRNYCHLGLIGDYTGCALLAESNDVFRQSDLHRNPP